MDQLRKLVERFDFMTCVPFNHLNNSRYLDYIMTARGDQLLNNYNFDEVGQFIKFFTKLQ